jgi:hypothetical protein
MFLYPQRARVERILPKNKVYGHAQPSRALRQRFIDEVEQITWKYKLAPETINLAGGSGVEEIQVFEITLKGGELREDVLRTIDRAIPSLIFFELVYDGRVRFAAAYKRMSEAAPARPVVDGYFLSPWQPAAAERAPLPAALDMAALYRQMLGRHMEASPFHVCLREDEPLDACVERVNQIRAKRRECRRLEAQLRKEAQFNRKVELNRSLLCCRAEVEALENGEAVSI